MKKGDLIIIAVILFFAAALFFLPRLKNGETVTVKKDNQTVYNGKLSADKTVDLGGNRIIIKNKKVYMENANCKNQICVHTGKISKKGESIICLPNKVVAEIN